jgi:hypothetical protein
MGPLFDKLFEGMDTPDGALFGVLSIGSSFFPFFNSFLKIFHAPVGWSPWAAGVLATFSCLFIKLLISTYHKELDLDLKSVQIAGMSFVAFLFMHYTPASPADVPIPSDPVLNLIFYVGLFASPTFAFTAMQFRRRRDGA